MSEVADLREEPAAGVLIASAAMAVAAVLVG
jgi:hypothetical protein